MFQYFSTAGLRAAIAAVGLFASSAGTAHAAPIMIDDFDGPAPPSAGQTFFITGSNGGGDPSPYLLKQSQASGILGGQRDSLVNVIGTAQLGSALGVVGWDNSRNAGLFQINTTPGPGSAVILQYDGADADTPTAPGTPAALVNGQGLGNVDLTSGGTNNALVLRFASCDAAGGLTINISATTAGGGTSTYTGSVADHASAYDLLIPFSSFAHTGGGVLTSISSITLVFNVTGVPNVDFALNSIAAVPEPPAFALLAVGACGLLVCGWRRRKQN